ncbi:MAG: DUF427 domain-containing protein [Pseudomonadota bacterium]
MTDPVAAIIEGAICNPDNPRHFMRLKPVSRLVTVSRGGTVLARTQNALRLLEVGRDLYDPLLYIPKTDIVGALEEAPVTKTHCPLKGEATYWRAAGEEAALAWSYETPFAFAAALAGRIAFDPAHVTVCEGGA